MAVSPKGGQNWYVYYTYLTSCMQVSILWQFDHIENGIPNSAVATASVALTFLCSTTSKLDEKVHQAEVMPLNAAADSSLFLWFFWVENWGANDIECSPANHCRKEKEGLSLYIRHLHTVRLAIVQAAGLSGIRSPGIRTCWRTAVRIQVP